ncbi:MAG: tetratricopeptide repeat protein [Defluviitaleaceae bacterium]|nr:tetratricopeptide repeat protein [Defluviitaleaceae bacterium]
MKTVAFYSYKGGVGRSLALAYTAKRLAECNFSVCVVDVDLEAPGIIHKLVKPEELNHSKKGTVDYIHTCLHDKPPESIVDYFYSCMDTKFGYIKLMSAGKGLDGGDYWYKLAKLDWVDLFAGENNEGLFIFEMLKHQIKTQFNPDYLFFDSRAGVTIMSKICCSVIPDAVILLTANNNENFHGSRLMYRHIKASTEFKPSGKPTDVFCALTRISESEKESDVLAKLVTIIGDTDLKPSDITVIHSDPDVEYNEHILTIDESDIKLERPIKADYYKLFSKILDPEMLEAKKSVIANDPKYEFIEYSVREFTEKELNRLRGEKGIETFYREIEENAEIESVSCDDLYALAVCKRHQDKPIDTIIYLGRAAVIANESEQLRADIHYLRGLISLYDLSNYAEAKKDLEVVKGLKTKRDSHYKYHYATCLFCLDEFDDAMSYIGSYLTGNSNDYRGYILKASIICESLKRNGKLNRTHAEVKIDEALCYFDRAIELNSNNWHSYNSRGLLYYNLNDTENAIADYSKVIELKPDYAMAYFYRGFLYGKLNDNENAIADYSKLIELKPDYAYAYNNRGLRYYDINDTENALADYNKAIELNPDYAYAYNNRGLLYYDINDTENALVDYSKAIGLNPDFALAYNNRRLLYSKIGVHEKAAEDERMYRKLTAQK